MEEKRKMLGAFLTRVKELVFCLERTSHKGPIRSLLLALRDLLANSARYL